ncbi:nuclease-related domain-containing protein [Neobacillus sp. LXY-1]|uniref:nuclease-related domain-containing protein n=1 Tax=Neobacillus sp. LXY-1 TaxID=3379133 RepID=UPI003EE24BFD
MIIKPRTEPHDLAMFRILNARMELSENDKRNFINLQKGYLGELKFDEFAERQLDDHIPILNDLLMKHNNSYFQIDSFIIANGVGNLIDIKNSEGDYIFRDGQFYPMGSNQEILNPLGQLDRCVTLLRKSLSIKDCQIPIKPYLAFVNPNFTLYQAPVHESLIFPTQLNAFMKKLNAGTTRVNGHQTKLIETLLAAHITKYPYSKLPAYSFEQLKKGITCCKCQSFSIATTGRKLSCLDCGYE